MANTTSQTGQDRLSSELLELLAKRGTHKDFAKGDLLFSEGDASESLYILISGQLKVFTQDIDGRELIYNVLDPGEFFGELFLDGGCRSASVKTLAHSRCIEVGQEELREFMQTYPEFAICLVVKLISRLRHATQQIRSLGLRDVYERVVDLLNDLSVPATHGKVVPLALTQLEIASRIAATREMVNHIIRDLVRGGYIIKNKENHFVILKELPKHR